MYLNISSFFSAFSFLFPSQFSKMCTTIDSFLRIYKIFHNNLKAFLLSTNFPVHLFLLLMTAFFSNSLLPALFSLTLIKSFLLFICLCPSVQLIHPLLPCPLSHPSVRHHSHFFLAPLSLSAVFLSDLISAGPCLLLTSSPL